MNKSGGGFNHLQNLFNRLSVDKINEGIFVRLKFKPLNIRKVISDFNFVRKMNQLEKMLGCNFLCKTK